jgi:hypothetical protein
VAARYSSTPVLRNNVGALVSEAVAFGRDIGSRHLRRQRPPSQTWRTSLTSSRDSIGFGSSLLKSVGRSTILLKWYSFRAQRDPKEIRMNIRPVASTSAAVALMTVLSAVPIAAQAAAAGTRRSVAANHWTPPKKSWGDPDLQGSWPTASLVGTPFERPVQFGERRFLTDDELAARDKQFADDAERVKRTTESGAEVDEGTGPPADWGEGSLRKAARITSLIVDPPIPGVHRVGTAASQKQWNDGTRCRVRTQLLAKQLQRRSLEWPGRSRSL